MRGIQPRSRSRRFTAVMAAGGLLSALLSSFNPAQVYAAPGALAVSGLSAPLGVTWLSGSLGGHFWVSDGGLGLCRIDAGVVNVATCDSQVKAPDQVASDALRMNADGTYYIYVADRAANSSGVRRLSFDPVTERIKPNKAELLDGGALQNRLRSSGAVLGPDGNLYVSFIKSPDIVRISNPNQPKQTAARISQTSDTVKGTRGGLAFVGNDLFLPESGPAGVSVIPDAVSCMTKTVSGISIDCGPAQPTPMTVNFPAALASQGDYLYVADSATTPTTGLDGVVLRYNLITGVQDAFSASHPPLADGTTRYKGISALGIGNGTLMIGDDPVVGIPGGQGHLWSVALAAAPDQAGAPGLPALAPPPAGAAPPAQLYAWGSQSPAGYVWLGGATAGSGHWWVADEAGFCRLDATPNGIYAANWTTCDDGSIGAPASIAYEPRPNADGTHYIYAPAMDRKSKGVWRLKFDPATETLVGTPQIMAPNANLGNIRPTAAALGPDGNLYVGGVRAGTSITKIADPMAADPRSQVVTVVGNTNNGQGISGSMAFLPGTSILYLAERDGLATLDVSACPQVGGTACKATLVDTGTVLSLPVAVTADAKGNLYVGDMPGATAATIVRFNPTTKAGTVLQARGHIPLATEPGAAPYCSTTCQRPMSTIDPTLIPGKDVPFDNVLALAMDPAGNLMFGTDRYTGARPMRGMTWLIPGATAIP